MNKKVNTAFPVKVQVLDAFNQVVTGDSVTNVKLELMGTGSGTLACVAVSPSTQVGPATDNTVKVSGGTASFSCQVGPTAAAAASNYQLKATSNPVLTSATSSYFKITT